MFLNHINRLSRQISFRLALWYSSFFALSAVILIGAVYLLLASSLKQSDREIILSKTKEYAARYDAGGIKALKKTLSSRTGKPRDTAIFVRVLGDDKGTLLLHLPQDWERIDLDHLETSISSHGEPSDWLSVPSPDDDEDALEIFSSRLSDGLILQVGLDTDQREDQLERFRGIGVGVAIPVVLFSFIAGFFLSRRFLSPIRSLISTVQLIQSGDISVRVPVRHSGDELEELATLFNRMLDQISVLIKGIRDTLDNVAHDLRTPMARLRGSAEMVLDSRETRDDPTALREALLDCVENSDGILTMLTTLMEISEAEAGSIPLKLEEVVLSELVDEVCDLYSIIAEEKSAKLVKKVSPDSIVQGDRNRLKQVLANLVDNALKYSDTGGEVIIHVTTRVQHVVIAVRDAGMGIPSDEIPKIWERLYRGDKSRSQRGLGLGLSLVRAIVRAHGGEVTVKSKVGLGSIFLVTLPRSQLN